MALKRFDQDLLTRIFRKIVRNYATQDEMDSANERIDSIVAEGGEPNVIEVVKENGEALEVNDKAVDVTVPTKVSELENDAGYGAGAVFMDDTVYFGSGENKFWYIEDKATIAYSEDSGLEYGDETIEYPDDSDDFGYDEAGQTIYFSGVDIQSADGNISYITDTDTGTAYKVYDVEAHESIQALEESVQQVDGAVTNLQENVQTLEESVEQIDGTVADLQESVQDIEAKITESVVEVTLSADAWSSEYPYTQTVAVEGVTADTLFYVGILYPEDCDRDTQEDINESAGYLFAIDSGDGVVTFKATELPTADIPLGLRGAF